MIPKIIKGYINYFCCRQRTSTSSIFPHKDTGSIISDNINNKSFDTIWSVREISIRAWRPSVRASPVCSLWGESCWCVWLDPENWRTWRDSVCMSISAVLQDSDQVWGVSHLWPRARVGVCPWSPRRGSALRTGDTGKWSVRFQCERMRILWSSRARPGVSSGRLACGTSCCSSGTQTLHPDRTRAGMGCWTCRAPRTTSSCPRSRYASQSIFPRTGIFGPEEGLGIPCASCCCPVLICAVVSCPDSAGADCSVSACWRSPSPQLMSSLGCAPPAETFSRLRCSGCEVCAICGGTRGWQGSWKLCRTPDSGTQPGRSWSTCAGLEKTDQCILPCKAGRWTHRAVFFYHFVVLVLTLEFLFYFKPEDRWGGDFVFKNWAFWWL